MSASRKIPRIAFASKFDRHAFSRRTVVALVAVLVCTAPLFAQQLAQPVPPELRCEWEGFFVSPSNQGPFEPAVWALELTKNTAKIYSDRNVALGFMRGTFTTQGEMSLDVSLDLPAFQEGSAQPVPESAWAGVIIDPKYTDYDFPGNLKTTVKLTYDKEKDELFGKYMFVDIGVKKDNTTFVYDAANTKSTEINIRLVRRRSASVHIYRPFNQDPAESEIPGPNARAYTLRNDGADWVIGNQVRTDTLPVADVDTDLDHDNIDGETGLVRIRVDNRNGSDGEYLFAFTDEAEDKLNGTIKPYKNSRRTTPNELQTWIDGRKSGRVSDFPVPIPAAGRQFYVEGRLGGTYRLVAGFLPQGMSADAVTTADDLQCSQSVTLKVAIVDIFQESTKKGSVVRERAFDLYWGGHPYFKARIWPVGGQYHWGVPYRRRGGAAVTLAGDGIDGPAASIVRDDEDARNGDAPLEVRGKAVTRTGSVANATASVAVIQGGIAVDHPEANGDQVSQVDNNPADRYPRRVTLAYTIDGVTMVRNEPVAVIAPQIQGPTLAKQQPLPVPAIFKGDEKGTDTSRLEYRITDGFGRSITAPSVEEYVELYGAGLKAWEALRPDPHDTFNPPGQQQAVTKLIELDKNLKESGIRDTLVLWWVFSKPISFGTAQRSQAKFTEDRMIKATFHDTLTFDPSTSLELLDDLKTWTGRKTGQDTEAARLEAERRKSEFRKAQGNPQALQEVVTKDRAKGLTTRFPVFDIIQDVILQLLVGQQRFDLDVLHENHIIIYAPFYISPFPKDPNDDVNEPYFFHLVFQRGHDWAPAHVVQRNYYRPN